MLKLQAEALLPTQMGNFILSAYSSKTDDWMPHLSLRTSESFSIVENPVNIRIHSECITGEVFHSKKCDCGSQLDGALSYIHTHGGVLIYLRQEGRGIGIINKIKAYKLQSEGEDTHSANLKLGLPADNRDFSPAVEILNILGIKKVNILTNNPQKIAILKNSGIIVNERIPLSITSLPENEEYMRVKKEIFGHWL